VLFLAACAAIQPPEIPQHGVTGGYQCSNAGLAQFVGQPASADVGAEMLRVSGARTIRWVRIGEMITMDFVPERLTVRLGPGNRFITQASCG
jgi:hypothetical protein